MIQLKKTESFFVYCQAALLLNGKLAAAPLYIYKMIRACNIQTECTITWAIGYLSSFRCWLMIDFVIYREGRFFRNYSIGGNEIGLRERGKGVFERLEKRVVRRYYPSDWGDITRWNGEILPVDCLGRYIRGVREVPSGGMKYGL